MLPPRDQVAPGTAPRAGAPGGHSQGQGWECPSDTPNTLCAPLVSTTNSSLPTTCSSTTLKQRVRSSEAEVKDICQRPQPESSSSSPDPCLASTGRTAQTARGHGRPSMGMRPGCWHCDLGSLSLKQLHFFPPKTNATHSMATPANNHVRPAERSPRE